MPPQQQDDVQLPKGYEDAKPVQMTGSQSRADVPNITLPKGYEDARPAQPTTQTRTAAAQRTPTIGPAHKLSDMTAEQRANYQLETGEEPPSRLSEWLGEGANYTPEGRREHPVRAFVGDTYKRLQDYSRLVAPMMMLAGPEGGPMEVKTPRVAVWKGAPAAPAVPEIAPIEKPVEIPRNWSGRQVPERLAPAAEAEAAPAPTRLQPVIEKPVESGPRFTETKRLPDTLTKAIDESAGVKRLEPNKPLREQIEPVQQIKAESIDPLKEKYPDTADRQMVRANGEKIFEAAGKDKPLMKQLHDLTRVDLRQALINAGEDMGQKTVSNSKFAGEGSISREQAFNRLLELGKKPEEIVQLSKPPAKNAEVPKFQIPNPKPADLKPGEGTIDRFFNIKTGEWAPERQANHQAMIDKLLEGKTPPKGRAPEATITVGGTGAGKTTITRQVLADNPHAVNIDADQNKLAIPEFEGLKKSDPQNAAARVHEESSHIAKRSVAAAVQKGLDFIFDTSTGGGGDALFQKLKDAGYKVKVLFADVPTDEAIKRANLRAVQSTDPTNRGRFVPESVIREKHQTAAKAFGKYRTSPFVDELHGYDTTGRTPQRFYEKVGSRETIHDRGRLDAVERKAAGRESAAAHREEPAPVH